MSIDPDLIRTWLTGWARARGVGMPIAQDDCWRVEIGWPIQTRRFVFPLPSPHFARLAQTITDPLVYLKAFQFVDALAAQLPPGWVVDPQYQMMLCDTLTVPSNRCPDGYLIQHDDRKACVWFEGAVVAEGQVVEEQGLAIFVGIKVDAAHRRRGLGGLVMAVLTNMAQELGARRGALVATSEGAALYRTLGWRDYAPYVSAHPDIQR